jgi:preprotein translocase subunit YajC
MEILSTITYYLAQAPAGEPASGGGMLPLVMMVLMFVMMYFLLIRPQRKQQREHRERVAALKIGDKVITSGGIHGLISNVKEATVTVKIADNVKVELEKSAVTGVTKKSDKEPAEEPAEEGGEK